MGHSETATDPNKLLCIALSEDQLARLRFAANASGQGLEAYATALLMGRADAIAKAAEKQIGRQSTPVSDDAAAFVPQHPNSPWLQILGQARTQGQGLYASPHQVVDSLAKARK